MRRWLIPVAMASVLGSVRPAAAFVPSSARLHIPPTLATGASRSAGPATLRSKKAAAAATHSYHAEPRKASQLRMVAATGSNPVKIVGPEWNNDDEYTSLDSVELKADLDSVSVLIDELSILSREIDMSNLDLFIDFSPLTEPGSVH